jgi:hypothetical protein
MAYILTLSLQSEVSSAIESVLVPIVKANPSVHFVKVHYEDIEFDNDAVPAILALRPYKRCSRSTACCHETSALRIIALYKHHLHLASSFSSVHYIIQMALDLTNQMPFTIG